MSVYTAVSTEALHEFLARYDLGTLETHEGIAAGIENTNYRVTTSRGRFVLTLFERINAGALPFCLNLMAYLADNGIPSAHPVADRTGVYLQRFLGKPTVLVRHLDGASILEPAPHECHTVGRILGRMHVLTQRYPHVRETDRGAQWHRDTAARVRPRLTGAERRLLDTELAHRLEFDVTALPAGVIHADLFRDNVLFDNDRLTGLIDFYYAHNGALIYDLAVACCDWCFEPERDFVLERMSAMLDGYSAERALCREEHAAWINCLRSAGLRFWLSRLDDCFFPRSGAITQIKDPDRFKAVLEAVERNSDTLSRCWE